MQQSEQIATEPYIPRQIQTELDAHRGDRIGRRIRPEQDARRIAGDQQEQEEGGNRHAQQRGQQQYQSPNSIRYQSRLRR